MGRRHLEEDIKRQGARWYKQQKQRVSNPFMCPNCAAKTIFINKIKTKPNGDVIWLAVCSKDCPIKYTITMPPAYQEIDVYNKVCELIRVEKEKN